MTGKALEETVDTLEKSKADLTSTVEKLTGMFWLSQGVIADLSFSYFHILVNECS